MKRPGATPHKPSPIRKERTIVFSKIPPGQASEACNFLLGLENLEVNPCFERLIIGVAYDLHDHSLEELEAALESKGFHLDNTLINKLLHSLIYYIEETQLHNLDAPARQLKRSQNEAYTHAWERHPHGDHDDTPPEWREYK